MKDEREKYPISYDSTICIGLYNCMSKYHFSMIVAKMFNLNDDFIKPVNLVEFEKKFSLVARRPKNISLNVSKIENELGKKMPTISEGIRSMKEKETDFKKAVRWLDAN